MVTMVIACRGNVLAFDADCRAGQALAGTLVALPAKPERRTCIIRPADNLCLYRISPYPNTVVIKSGIILFAFIAFASCGQKDKEVSTPQTVAPAHNELPPIRLMTSNGQTITGKGLPGQSILIFFQPDCDHCQREAQAIANHLTAFDGYAIYFITPAAFDEIQRFAIEYGLDEKENVHFTRATTEDILGSVGAISAPSMFIYSAEKKLVKHLDGETTIDEILGYL
jgi:hypothetical protein